MKDKKYPRNSKKKKKGRDSKVEFSQKDNLEGKHTRK